MNPAQRAITSGDLPTLARISLPLLLFLFCESLTAFAERIFLSRYSSEAVASSLSGTYLAFMFNNPCTAIASMAQVFIGHYQGGGELRRIGPCIWQLIWFSFLSLIITLPLSFWSSSLYFKGTAIEQMGKEYFTILALGNFLFPLNTALASFYLGRGKTTIVTLLMLSSYALNLILSWMLIAGIAGFLPPLGVRGAALAKCLSLGLLNLIFLKLLLAKKNREIYQTNIWHLSLSALWSYIKPGLVRAFGCFWLRIGWVLISSMMMKKGGAYLDILTIGGTIITFLVFIPSGVYRSVLTISSNLLGAKNYPEVWRLCRSLIIYVLILAIILAIPVLIFPHSLIFFFDASSYDLFDKIFGMINHWIWLYVVAVTLQVGICGFIIAVQDLRAQFYGYLFSYLTSLAPIYIMMYRGQWDPAWLWLIMAIENFIFAVLFFYRFCQRKWETEQWLTA